MEIDREEWKARVRTLAPEQSELSELKRHQHVDLRGSGAAGGNSEELIEIDREEWKALTRALLPGGCDVLRPPETIMLD